MMLPGHHADYPDSHRSTPHKPEEISRNLPQVQIHCGQQAVGNGLTDSEAPFPRFVIQEHHARRLHWDFRLERDGVLKSWAIPKGLPLESGIKRLAIEVEDHPLNYIDFTGTIPAGSYGAGTVSIWDHGHYGVAEWKEDKIVVVLLGERVQGSYHLVRTQTPQWLIFRGKEI